MKKTIIGQLQFTLTCDLLLNKKYFFFILYFINFIDDSPELCTPELSRIISEEEPCYITMIIIILVLIVSGMSSITYYALGISYLDDNTKKKHVTGFIGVIIAVKIAGIVLGYFLGWGCLR